MAREMTDAERGRQDRTIWRFKTRNDEEGRTRCSFVFGIPEAEDIVIRKININWAVGCANTRFDHGQPIII
jgi:hypothetical protein